MCSGLLWLVLDDKRSLPPRRPSFIAFQGRRVVGAGGRDCMTTEAGVPPKFSREGCGHSKPALSGVSRSEVLSAYPFAAAMLNEDLNVSASRIWLS
jgi:hypothetical protein